MSDVSEPKLHEITRSQFALYSQVKHCKLSGPFGKLEANSDRPDLPEPQRGFLPHELAFVPGFTMSHRRNVLIHDTSPGFWIDTDIARALRIAKNGACEVPTCNTVYTYIQ
jgi:hypothetical protein